MMNRIKLLHTDAKSQMLRSATENFQNNPGIKMAREQHI